MKMYLILAVAIIFNATANIFIKVGMNKSAEAGMSGLAGIIKGIVLNPVVAAGVLLFGLALGAYSYVLSQMNLSVAYPIMTSVGYMIVILASWLFLKETIGLSQVFGFLMIIGGVWLVAA